MRGGTAGGGTSSIAGSGVGWWREMHTRSFGVERCTRSLGDVPYGAIHLVRSRESDEPGVVDFD